VYRWFKYFPKAAEMLPVVEASQRSKNLNNPYWNLTRIPELVELIIPLVVGGTGLF